MNPKSRSPAGLIACGALAAAVAFGMPARAAQESKPAPSVTAAGITLDSVSVTLPSPDRTFPQGPGMETVTNNCTACHSAGMVLNQPTLSKATWQEEVNKMRVTYKAPIAEEDVPAIVEYLAAHKGTK